MKPVRKAVIPAAGLGTRFLPATKGLPKEMLPIIDKPTLLYQVEEAVNAGCEEVILIISKAKEDIKKFFVREENYEQYLRSKGQDEFADEIKRIATLCKITYVYQNEMKGLGHAILCTKEAVGDEPFLVILGDDLVINKNAPTASAQLIEAYNKTGTSILGVQKVSLEATKKYGIVDPISEEGRLILMKGMVEKPSSNPPSLYAALGRYVITSDIFDLLDNLICSFPLFAKVPFPNHVSGLFKSIFNVFNIGVIRADALMSVSRTVSTSNVNVALITFTALSN